MSKVSATPEEVLSVVQELFPREYDRSVAELTIRKLEERVVELERLVPDHGHPHPHSEALGEEGTE